MKARIAKKIYKHLWLQQRCIGIQQAINYQGSDPCCEEYGDLLYSGGGNTSTPEEHASGGRIAHALSGAISFARAFSLSRLLSFLPKDLTEQGKHYRLVIGPDKNKWAIEYNDMYIVDRLYWSEADTLIEAAVQMIETLNFHNHPLNQPEP